MEDVLVPVVMFMMVLGIVVAVQAAGTIRRENVLKTVRQAMQSGQTVMPEIIQALGVNRVNTKAKDIKSGLVLMAIAVALIIFGQTLNMTIPSIDDPDVPNMLYIFVGLASFPGLIGLVLLGFGLTRKDKDASEITQKTDA